MEVCNYSPWWVQSINVSFKCINHTKGFSQVPHPDLSDVNEMAANFCIPKKIYTQFNREYSGYLLAIEFLFILNLKNNVP